MSWIEDNTRRDPQAKEGMRIRMLHMDDQHGVDEGMEGTIMRIDDLGTLHVNWDDGSQLGVIPELDKYELLPAEDEQVDIMDLLGEDKNDRLAKNISKQPLSKSVDNLFKSSNSKYKIKIESEEVAGGEAEGMSPKDLAKKHKVDIKDIEKEIEVGTKIEMEHTDSKKMAKEIAMDHIAEFPDYYTNKKYGVKASEKGLEKELEETTTTGALGTSPIQPLGNPIRKTKSKKVSSNVVTKGDLKNPLGKIYSLKSESKIIKAKDLLSEISSTHASKLRSAEGTYDGDSWVGKNGWQRRKELAWKGGKIADLLAKLDINWSDSNLSLTDKETDAINEGWFKKTKEDKLALEILERVKEEYPQDTVMGRFRLGRGNYIEFTLDGLKGTAIIRLESSYSYGDVRNSYGLWVNNRRLLASRWAIRKLYKYVSEELTKRKEEEDLKNIETDLISPDYAEDVFDQLGNSETMNEAKKKKTKESPIHTKKWERCVKDVKKKNEENKTDYNPYAVCQKSIGYEGSIKKPHRRQDEIKESSFGISPIGGIFSSKRSGSNNPKRKTSTYNQERDDENINKNSLHKVAQHFFGVDYDELEDKQKKQILKVYGELKNVDLSGVSKNLEETTTFSSVFGGGFPVTPFMFAKKGKHIPSKKPIWKGGKIVQKADKADLLGESLLDEINKVKWVKGGKFVKIKDRCAKYNNKPWCSQGAIDNPLELSDTTFESIENVSKQTGLSEEYIYNKVIKYLNSK